MSSSAQNQAQESSALKDASNVNTTSATTAAPKPEAISTSPDTHAAAPSNNTNNNNTTSSTSNTTHANTSTTTPAMTAVVAAATAAAAASTDTKNAETDEEAIRNQKLVEEFQYLLEKSQSLFSGLSRDLPPTGSHRQWRPYFEKTFEVYTKLWKFQQTHRSILENKSNYGLKRWEVGEIASKIGQLYYHYYLRTSETNYLHEAYVFYEAIHERQYFKDILEVKNSALMIKKMRYYARFIIVCLLLNKDENVRQLITELEGLIEEYTKSFKPPDAKEWQMVLEEISTFTEAEKKLVPINLDRTPDKIEHRLSSNMAERNIVGLPKLKLQEAILVGNYQKQIKFSELTLDMYRMLQSLEREPFVLHPSVAAATKNKSTETSDKTKEASKDDQSNTTAGTTATTAAAAATVTATSSATANTSRPVGTSTHTYSASHIQTTSEKVLKRSNPHKYLLYRPSLSQLLVYISTAFKDTSDNSALLLYLSADGCAYPDQTVPGYGGGVMTSQRNKLTSGTTAERASGANTASNANTATASSSGNTAATAAAASSSSNTANAGPTGAGVSGANTSSSTTVGNGGAGASSGGTIPTTNSVVGSMTASANNAASANTVSNAVNANNKETSTNTQYLADSHHHISPPSVHCLHPADLVPFTRKPLFLIVDSDHSTEFKHMPNVFDQPVMCLMSPVEYPSSVQDKSEIGSLFTLFLHTPLLGFCSVSDIGNLDQQKWDECVRKIGAMEKAIGDLLITDSSVDINVKRFMMDDFLYYFIVRFVLCGIFLRYHSSFKDDKSFPSSCPALPESVYVSTEIVTMLGDLTAIADVGTYFSLPAYATSSAANSVINMAPSSTSAVASANSGIGGGGGVAAAAANNATTASTATAPSAALPTTNNNSTNTNSNSSIHVASSSPPLPPVPSQTATMNTTTAIMEMK
ncbi:hypothetical protein HMPREF1544_11113 [Mucor circinelloides 1006PhL]|uniref:Protein SCAI n=1 Tax=Mucor circinelloides f. circinelloides (strain 1006PhL) TaxID=1220926 RepID=S2J1W1_MUCC1|nr:hypothetical protein HMPREF1544_11113 [Mucor circinelloides 1006PhL]